MKMSKEAKRILRMTKKIWRALTPEERRKWLREGNIDFVFLVQEIVGLRTYQLCQNDWCKIHGVIDND